MKTTLHFALTPPPASSNIHTHTNLAGIFARLHKLNQAHLHSRSRSCSCSCSSSSLFGSLDLWKIDYYIAKLRVLVLPKQEGLQPGLVPSSFLGLLQFVQQLAALQRLCTLLLQLLQLTLQLLLVAFRVQL